MQLFTSWGNSLKLLQPKNLTLFLLVTAKTITQTYKTWLTYFWWLPLLMGAFFLVFGPRLGVTAS